MWSYYLFLAWRNMWKTPVLTILMMLALGFGMSFSLVLLTLNHSTSYNPLEHKLDKLYSVQTDNWSNEPGSLFFGSTNFMPTALNFRDAKALLASEIPVRSTMLSFSGAILDNPDKPETLPQNHGGYMVTRDFFRMFEVDFLYGSAWEKQNVFSGIHKIVLSHWMNQVFFDGENSVGKMLLVDGRPYTVSGVLVEGWHLAPKVYDPSSSPLGASSGFYFPFEDIALYDYHRWGGIYSWKPENNNTHEFFLDSEILWVRPWFEFDDLNQKHELELYIKAYIEQEQENDRYRRSNKVVFSNTSEWMMVVSGYQGLGEVVITILILLICATNSIALLMSKFLKITVDSAIRRALGASRLSIFIQHLYEAFLIALGGGFFALLIGAYWFEVLKKTMSGYEYEYLEKFAKMDFYSLVMIFILVFVSTLLCGAIPAWRVSRAQPGRYLSAE